jgi:hypothetical protein
VECLDDYLQIHNEQYTLNFLEWMVPVINRGSSDELIEPLRRQLDAVYLMEQLFLFFPAPLES